MDIKNPSKIYLDHQIVGDEENWELLTNIKSKYNLDFVFSEWHLVEIAQGKDKQQAIKRAKFIDSLNPLWSTDYFLIQKFELVNFLKNQIQFKEKFVKISVEKPIFTYLSQLISLYYKSPSLGANAEKMVKAFFSDKQQLNPIEESKSKSFEAISTSRIKNNLIKKYDKDIFIEWIKQRLSFNEIFLSDEDRNHIAKWCYSNKNITFEECPSLYIESIISDIRAENSLQPAKQSDAIDLQHSVIALSLCNYFVSKDKYLKNCAEKAIKKYNGNVKIFEKIQEFIGSMEHKFA